MLPNLYHVTTCPESIPFDDLPQSFVVKASHGSGWVRIVLDKDGLDRQDLIANCSGWLSSNYHRITREKAYKSVLPRIMIEEFIDDGNTPAPIDYKFQVFHGRVELILVITGRYFKPLHMYLDRDWQPVGVSAGSYKAVLEAPARPPHLAQMIAAAEKLAHGIDFIRVDFYDTPDRFIFGELTSTPGSGLDRYTPDSFDLYLGTLWKWRTPARKD